MDAGIYTILREKARAAIQWAMKDSPTIDMERLKADMARRVERTSGRSFSLAATGGKNPDFYRNFINHGQDKRLTADVFVGIVYALQANPADYVVGVKRRLDLPNSTVLTATFAVMLGALGIDPNEDGRAHKLAERFPDTLRGIEALATGAVSETETNPDEDAPALSTGRRAS